MNAQETVASYLHSEGPEGPLVAVARAAQLSRELEIQQRAAVRRAAAEHSWAEIGAALGVSKQAAHHKFVRGLGEDLQAHAEQMKAAGRAGNAQRVATARRSLRATVELMQHSRGDSSSKGKVGQPDR